MKTLLLLIIGTLFGIWFYNHHSNLIPVGVTDNIDHSVEWLKDLWPEQESTTPKEKQERRPQTVRVPEVDASLPTGESYTPAAPRQNTSNRRATSETPTTPRNAAMESYTRTIRMIDSSY